MKPFVISGESVAARPKSRYDKHVKYVAVPGHGALKLLGRKVSILEKVLAFWLFVKFSLKRLAVLNICQILPKKWLFFWISLKLFLKRLTFFLSICQVFPQLQKIAFLSEMLLFDWKKYVRNVSYPKKTWFCHFYKRVVNIAENVCFGAGGCPLLALIHTYFQISRSK